jgi:hypothetical protein
MSRVPFQSNRYSGWTAWFQTTSRGFLPSMRLRLQMRTPLPCGQSGFGTRCMLPPRAAQMAMQCHSSIDTICQTNREVFMSDHLQSGSSLSTWVLCGVSTARSFEACSTLVQLQAISGWTRGSCSTYHCGRAGTLRPHIQGAGTSPDCRARITTAS